MEEKELLTANALFSDAKLKRIASRCANLERKIDGDNIIYSDGDEILMTAKFYPLFELEGQEFRPFIDIPQPTNESEFNALIAVLYTKFTYIDYYEVGNKRLWIGLQEFNPRGKD